MRPGGGTCERCYRLNKTCLPGESLRSLNAQRNNPIARIAQLEGKLDGIVSLLGAGRPVIPPPPQDQPIPLQVLSPVASHSSNISLSPGSGTCTTTGFLPAGAPPSSTQTGAAHDDRIRITEWEPSPDEADEGLAYFRDHMLKYFAFLHISSSADAASLRRERPFLFLCIMAASSQSTRLKLALSERIKHTLARRIFLDKNDGPGAVTMIDLLLGLLTFLAWGHDHLLHGTSASLSRFTQLAMSLVFDLRLNKPLHSEDSNMLPVGSLSDPSCADPRGPARSLEERRAVLGCFVMSSIVSSYFAQIDAMQWTSHMEDCLTVLGQSNESPYDAMFAEQVRLQRVAAEIESARTAATTVPLPFHLSAVRTKIDAVKAHFSAEVQQNEVLLASLHHTELSALGLLLSGSREAAAAATPGSSFQRLEGLHACLETVRAALDNFFAVPIADYAGISFPFFTQLARYLVALYRLSVLGDPAWDTSLARATVDLMQVADRLIVNMQHARAASGEKAAEGFLDRAIRIFTSFRSWCAANMAEGGAGNGDREGSSRAPGQPAVGGGGSAMLLDMSLDDLWLGENFTYGFLDDHDFGGMHLGIS